MNRQCKLQLDAQYFSSDGTIYVFMYVKNRKLLVEVDSGCLAERPRHPETPQRHKMYNVLI